jgi:predicted DNA helicase
MNFKNLAQYQDYFRQLISEERKAEMDFHLQEIIALSGKQRERKGRAILLLTGRDSGIGIGGAYLVNFVRASGIPDNEFSTGDVVIASKENPQGDEPQGTVVKKTKRSITIAYSTTPPYLVYQKNIRLDLFSNDITFQRMEKSLASLDALPLLQKRLLNTIELLADYSDTKSDREVNPILNTSQQLAIEKGLDETPVFLIHGPPGTGKTTTLSTLIQQYIKANKKVLVTAPSNTAVDNILEKLIKEDLQLVRIGNPIKVADSLLNCSLDVQLQEHASYQNANGIWSKAQLLQKEQQDYIPATGQNKRGLKDEAIIHHAKLKKAYRGIPQSQLRKMAKWLQLQNEINRLYDQANTLQQEAIDSIIDRSQVVFATNAGAGSELLKDTIFDVVCIDEATQSTEPESLIALTKGRKWVLAGDHQQLPPTVKSARAIGLKESLFERLLKLNGNGISQMLSIQYRMNKQIMSFSNEQFYENKLHAHPANAGHSLADLPSYAAYPLHLDISPEVTESSKAVVFINASEGQEKAIAEGFSFYNEGEQILVQKVADNLLSSRLFPEDIGIISPYDQQVSQLKRKLKDYQIEIKTVDGFQGREKEVIIISLVRANSYGKLGFLKDYRRLNVAITRAKRKLIIIGHADTLKQDAVYNKFLLSIPSL